LNGHKIIPSESDFVLKDNESKDKNQNSINTEIYNNILYDIRHKQGIIQEKIQLDGTEHNSRSIIKNRKRKEKDKKVNLTPSEINGYMPKREDFDHEYINDAELLISEIEFSEDDTQSDIDLKLNMLKVYNAELLERDKRKS